MNYIFMICIFWRQFSVNTCDFYDSSEDSNWSHQTNSVLIDKCWRCQIVIYQCCQLCKHLAVELKVACFTVTKYLSTMKWAHFELSMGSLAHMFNAGVDLCVCVGGVCVCCEWECEVNEPNSDLRSIRRILQRIFGYQYISCQTGTVHLFFYSTWSFLII